MRGDFLYSSMRPRTQAALDLVLYIVFFLPGIAALLYAGYHYAAIPGASTSTDLQRRRPADLPVQVRHPDGRRDVMLQGIAEIVRCVVCLRTGAWPAG